MKVLLDAVAPLTKLPTATLSIVVIASSAASNCATVADHDMGAENASLATAHVILKRFTGRAQYD